MEFRGTFCEIQLDHVEISISHVPQLLFSRRKKNQWKT